MPEAVWYKLWGHGRLIQRGVVIFLRFSRRDVSYWLQKTPVVEPVDPLERCELDGFEVSPRPTPMNDLGLVKPVDRFCERVVIGVAYAPDRGVDACFCQPLGIANGHVLDTPLRVMHKATARTGLRS